MFYTLRWLINDSNKFRDNIYVKSVFKKPVKKNNCM